MRGVESVQQLLGLGRVGGGQGRGAAAPGARGSGRGGLADDGGVDHVGVGLVDVDMGRDQRGELLERLVEVGGDLVDEPGLLGLLGGELAVAGGVLEDHPHGGLRADDGLQQRGAAPAGEDAEARLGQADAAHAGGGGAHVGHERDLEAAAEGDAVEVGEDRDGAGAHADLQVVGGAGHRADVLGGGGVGEHRQVGAGEEGAAGAGQGDRADLPGLGPVERGGDRAGDGLDGARAEGRGAALLALRRGEGQHGHGAESGMLAILREDSGDVLGVAAHQGPFAFSSSSAAQLSDTAGFR